MIWSKNLGELICRKVIIDAHVVRQVVWLHVLKPPATARPQSYEFNLRHLHTIIACLQAAICHGMKVIFCKPKHFV